MCLLLVVAAGQISWVLTLPSRAVAGACVTLPATDGTRPETTETINSHLLTIAGGRAIRK